MRKFRTFLLFFIFLFCFCWLSTSVVWKRSKAGMNCNEPDTYIVENKVSAKLVSKATEAKTFTKEKRFNEKLCFLVDMSVSSGKNRFLVYNMETDSIINSGLVTHGRCNEMWMEGRKYSNVPGCGCTSLGKYKIGYSYNGTFGLAYKLYGLDKTNDNAFKRFVVLHAHECLPETEVQNEICQSDGCPTVAPGYLQQLNQIIDKSTKPILLWIYE